MKIKEEQKEIYLKGFDDGRNFQKKKTANFIKKFVDKYKKTDDDRFNEWLNK